MLFKTIILPLDDIDSNYHQLIVYPTNAQNFGRAGKDGYIYAKSFEITHSEHETCYGNKKQWYKIIHNRQIKSVSEEGVD